MSHQGFPEIVKHAERVAVAIETAVAGFPRLHRYTHGAVLRTRAMDVWESTVRAWRQRDKQLALIEQLSEKIDGLKLFYKTVRELGAMCGGWKKHVARQNPAGQQHGTPERPERLGARAASFTEAHP